MLAEIGAYSGVLSSLIGGTVFLVALSMILKAIKCGASIAIAEWALKCTEMETREKICRWLGDKEEIMKYLDQIDEKLGKKTKS